MTGEFLLFYRLKNSAKGIGEKLVNVMNEVTKFEELQKVRNAGFIHTAIEL